MVHICEVNLVIIVKVRSIQGWSVIFLIGRIVIDDGMEDCGVFTGGFALDKVARMANDSCTMHCLFSTTHPSVIAEVDWVLQGIDLHRECP